MKTTYRKLYKFHTKALAEDWLIKKNPQDVYDFYIIDEDKFYYNVIEDKKLIPQSGVGAVTVSENGVAKGTTSNVDFIDGDNTTFDVVKDLITGKIKVKVNASGGGGGGNSTKSFPKHTSLTVADVGKLAMNKLFVINEPPQSFADVEYKAVVADTTPAVVGTKGVYKIEFGGIQLEQPVTKLIKVAFSRQPNLYDQVNFINENGTIFAFGFITDDIEGIHIGVDLATTIENIVTYFTDNSVGVTVYDSDATSVTFEMITTAGDAIKYLQETDIYPSPINTEVTYDTMTLAFTDIYSNTVLLEHDGIDNGDGYYGVTEIGNVPVSNLFMKISDNTLFRFFSGVYTSLTFTRNEMGELTIVGSNSGFNYYPNVFPAVSNTYTVTTERSLTIDAASKAQAIYNLQNNYLLQNNNGRTLIDYASIFRNDSGQPNGTLGAFGLKYFANDSEVIDALNWALLNTTGNYFSSMFDIVTPLAYNGGTEKYEIVITNKTAPTSSENTNFQNNNQQGVEVETSTVSGAELGSPEKIGYAIIGKIVGVDGDNVLIDKSQMYDLTMHADANGVIPATADFNSADYLVAWKGGTVIDLQRFKTIMGNAGVNENDAYRLMTTVSGFFKPLSKGLPSGLVTCEKTTFAQ